MPCLHQRLKSVGRSKPPASGKSTFAVVTYAREHLIYVADRVTDPRTVDTITAGLHTDRVQHTSPNVRIGPTGEPLATKERSKRALTITRVHAHVQTVTSSCSAASWGILRRIDPSLARRMRRSKVPAHRPSTVPSDSFHSLQQAKHTSARTKLVVDHGKANSKSCSPKELRGPEFAFELHCTTAPSQERWRQWQHPCIVECSGQLPCRNAS